MALFAEQFFTDHLTLPYPQSTVTGDAYYAAPAPDLTLRLRIDFAPTTRAGEYEGLRLRVIHLDHGQLDTAVLRFAGHGAFEVRDRRQGREPGQDGYAVFRDWPGEKESAPWWGIGVAGLRSAIGQYVTVWFPGAPPVRTEPRIATAIPAPPTPTGPAQGR